DQRIGRMTKFHPLPGLGAQLKPGRPVAGGAVRDDAREAVNFGAIFRAVTAIAPADDDEPLALHAEPVVGIEVDAATYSVLRKRLRTTRDRRQSGKRPANAHDAVAVMAAVFKRQRWDDTGGAGRDSDRDRVGRRA